MSTNFTGVTFAHQHVAPADDAIIRRSILTDGILSGCKLGYSGSTLTMAAGHLMICGRQILHSVSQNWAVTEASSGFARLLLTIDLSRTSTSDEFDQVVDTIEYADAVGNFPSLTMEDINNTGTRYQMVVCTVSLGRDGITGIVSQAEASTPSLGDKSVLLVYAPTGSKVTCAKGNIIKQAVENNGLWRFNSLENGDWTITGTLDKKKATITKSIPEFGVYRETIEYSMIPDFTFDGAYDLVDDDNNPIYSTKNWEGNWNLILKESGTFYISNMRSLDRVDIFGVGGAGGTYRSVHGGLGWRRGFGGAVASHYNAKIERNKSYPIAIGAASTSNEIPGGDTSGFGYVWKGGSVQEWDAKLPYDPGVTAFDGTSPFNRLYGGNMEEANGDAPPNTGKGGCDESTTAYKYYYDGSEGVIIIRNARG